MRLMEGGSLAGQLARRAPSPRASAALIETVARAVHHAHQRGILHRDLKPANILLDAQGQPHVTDFGLARRLDGSTHLTQPGAIVGTPGYMAPEQAAGDGRPLTTAADVYALGAILYELLTGRPPFQAATPLETVLQVIADEPVPVRRLRPQVPKDLATICHKCLEKDPKKRYASAEALAEDLHRFGVGEPVEARPVGLAGRTVRWARRRPAVAGLLAACGAAMLALAVGGWQHNVQLGRQARLLEEALDEARKEHDRAQDNLNQALEAVDQLLRPLDDSRLARLPQFEETRRRMLEDALHFYQGFLRQQGNDLAVRRDSARAYSRSIMLHVLLGQTAKAEKAAEEARRLYDDLIADFPDRPEYRHGLAKTHAALAYVCTVTGRFDRALQAHRDALALGEELVREHPGELAYRESLVNTHRSLGFFTMPQGLPGAERHLRQVIEHASVLVQAQPGTAEWECLLAAGHAQLGQLLFNFQRLDQAATELDRARELLEPAGRPPPTAAREYPLVRGLMLVYRGGVALRQGQPAKAEPLLRDGVAAYEELVADAPNLFPYRTHLNIARTFLAQAYEQLGQPAQAEAVWQKAAESTEQMARAFPAFAPFAETAAVDARTHKWSLAVRRGDHAAVMGELGRLESRKELPGAQAYRLARVAALASAAAGPDAVRAEEYAHRAVALLGRAEAAGYFRQPGVLPQVRTDADLDPLRQRSDFRALMGRLEKAAVSP
jgi:serine/threonine-protein kinase